MKSLILKEKIYPNKQAGYVKTFSVVINPEDNGGESVTLSVDVYDNGDGLKEGMFTNTKIENECYGVSSAAIKLWGVGFESLSEAVQKISSKLEEMKS